MTTYFVTPIYMDKNGIFSSKLGKEHNNIPITATNINTLRKRLINDYTDKAAFIKVSKNTGKIIGELWFGTYSRRWKTIDYIPNYGQSWTFYKVNKDGTLGSIIEKLG